MDPNGDGIIGEKEGRAIARSSAKSRASNMKYKKGLCATLALLTLSWIGNTVLVMVIVYVNFKKTLNKSSLHHISAISCPDLMWDVAITHPIGHAAALGELQQEFKEFEWLQSD